MINIKKQHSEPYERKRVELAVCRVAHVEQKFDGVCTGLLHPGSQLLLK